MVDSTAIKTFSLSKEFVRNRRVVDKINLSVNKGELFCLVGANGAGKSTLIKLLCNLILPTSGEIFINGYDMLHDSKKACSCIGLVTGDERSFYWRLTGRENMEFFAALYNLSTVAARKKINGLFEMLHIEEPDKRFQEYPSGVKQRLSIARSLLDDPDILFIDELTKNLDPLSARDLRRFIKETLVGRQGKTIFFSTHQLYEVEELADRIAFMVDGRIIAVGTLDELKALTGTQDVTIDGIYSYFINKRD